MSPPSWTRSVSGGDGQCGAKTRSGGGSGEVRGQDRNSAARNFGERNARRIKDGFDSGGALLEVARAFGSQ